MAPHTAHASHLPCAAKTAIPKGCTCKPDIARMGGGMGRRSKHAVPLQTMSFFSEQLNLGMCLECVSSRLLGNRPASASISSPAGAGACASGIAA